MKKQMPKLILLTGLFCLLMVIGTSSGSFAGERKMLVGVEIDDPSDILKLQQMDMDIATEGALSPIQVVVSDAELAKLREEGWQVNILIDDLVRNFEENINIDGNLGNYHTYDEMLQEMQQVAAMYPDIARLIDIGDGWEKTEGLADRDIWAMKISDTPDLEEPEEADVLIVGCHHAREIVTVEIPLAIIRTLTKLYSQNPRVKSLVDNREIWVVPMLNPDGHAYVAGGNPMWRKNRNTNGYSNPSYQGVDLNRNYGFMWGYNNSGSSPYPWSETYRGTAPFSEPEAQAIRNLAENHDFVISLSYHSYGRLFLFPWGYIDEDTEDHPIFEKLGRIYSRRNGYIYGNAKDNIIYNTNGDFDDWMYGEQTTKNKVFGATIEVGDTFQPPQSEIPELIRENLKPALWMVHVAGKGQDYLDNVSWAGESRAFKGRAKSNPYK